MQPLSRLVAIALLSLSFFPSGCGHPPADNSSASQTLPFDRPPASTGVSPSQSLIPSTTKLPEGAAIPVRLQSALSSASSHAGDTFYAIVDEPVEIDGQTVVARGTPATGRVLEVRASGSSRDNSQESSQESSPEPGYLRIVLVSLNIGGRHLAITTSSIFARGGSREERSTSRGAASRTRGLDSGRNKDIEFGVDRHLSFRLAQTVDFR
jgi:hypothetical protein